MHRAAAITALMVAGVWLVACGSGAGQEGAPVPTKAPRSASSPSPAAPSTSVSEPAPIRLPECGVGAQHLRLAAAHGIHLDALALGRGPVGAVLLHEIGQSGMCGFWGYAVWLERTRHIRTVLVNRCGYGATSCPADTPGGDALIAAETTPAVAWLHRHGARRVTLMGASGGGGDALEAAAVVPGVDAVVDVSGDVTDTGADIGTVARRVHVPALLALARNDPYCSLPTMRAEYAHLPAATKQLVIDPNGGVHGWSLLVDVDNRALPLARTTANWITGRYR